jgi:hypothetical protein
MLLQTYLVIYERQQAAYLSKLYSRMKLATLKAYIGNTDIDGFLNKYGWKLSNNIITTVEVPELLDTYDLKEEINFQNQMTMYLENITKANSVLRQAKSEIK